MELENTIQPLSEAESHANQMKQLLQDIKEKQSALPLDGDHKTISLILIPAVYEAMGAYAAFYGDQNFMINHAIAEYIAKRLDCTDDEILGFE